MAKIVVGMSGGVDSAVAAKLLLDQGHEVIGVFMRNWDALVNNDVRGNPDLDQAICPSEAEWQDVQQIGKQLGIVVKRIDFVRQYWDYVFADLIDKYKQGLTPNPDILCNKYIKFGTFYEWVFANIANVDYIATGHYAKLTANRLQIPRDTHKDQTYFLAQVLPSQFAKTIFPLHNITKQQVRAIAREAKLIVANKKDSTGICFIGKRNFTDFLQNYIPAQPGPIHDIVTNRIVGHHVGAMYYTIGQRKGLNLGGMSEPYYVVGHDLLNKIVYVAPQSNQSYLVSKSAIITDLNWFDNDKQDRSNILVKLRYNSAQLSCSIKWIDQHSLEVFYPEGFMSAAPGQQAVFYDDKTCLGGGVIKSVKLIEGMILK